MIITSKQSLKELKRTQSKIIIKKIQQMSLTDQQKTISGKNNLVDLTENIIQSAAQKVKTLENMKEFRGMKDGEL